MKLRRQLCKTIKSSWLDIGVILVISANAVFIGLQVGDENADEKWNQWMILDIICSLLFWFELIFKLSSNGWRYHFILAPDRIFNMFDASLVILDSVQQGLAIFLDEKANAKVFALIRIIRLVRLAKLLRVLRTEYFRN